MLKQVSNHVLYCLNIDSLMFSFVTILQKIYLSNIFIFKIIINNLLYNFTQVKFHKSFKQIYMSYMY